MFRHYEILAIFSKSGKIIYQHIQQVVSDTLGVFRKISRNDPLAVLHLQ